ncbi:SusD-like starch-binding protein associating with outer membrane [Algoriphagus ratkowskyi]|uniref:SusD-like starch-binding protein associating with outer membrane n=1 Tax=Algoriphagus ratkowskyi TaxID=57028 RepID=A0A2W7S3V8_9BACT|nr:SusD/RagB family nutrient-binding outer membrane lipoprotein [Algoriphagus ratkowskyi]PZX57725.1 SusD-like starch-binding protein associating with outer membrane [Algoriphagus ratkowskyi]TXD78994.1 SusD/RagB family nutrient-binding outer membrane lipoprotein [Algoriphagus ratkowskyi]
MKKLNIMIVAALVLVGCNNFDDNININPNVPSQASGTQLIANAMLSLSGLSSSPQGEFMSQYLSETQYVNASLYPQSSTSFYGWYQGPLMNLETVLTADDLSGVEGPVPNQLAVAKILKSYYIWHLTDRWGDIPYTQALMGADNFTPAYDSQESIYTDLFKVLDEATSQIVSGSITNDIIFNGDMTKWSKLANTLKMLMALRLSEVNPTLGKEKFAAALQAGVITSNSGNLVFKHLADANNQNYWYNQIDLQGREWWAISETLMDKMKPVSDPRLMVYAAPNRTDGKYTGLVFGETVNIDTEKYALLGKAIHAQDAPIYLVTYAQALFAQAEAAKRGWISGGDASAEDNYKKAIVASMDQWGADKSTLNNFMTQPEIAYSPAMAMEQIATQRWVHLFMHGYEGWAEYRRTGYPNNMVSPGGSDVPNRQIYIETEQFNNTDNYNEAVQRQFGGPESLYGKVWWDVN